VSCCQFCQTRFSIFIFVDNLKHMLKLKSKKEKVKSTSKKLKVLFLPFYF